MSVLDILDWFEFARVEFLVKKIPAVVVESIEALCDSVNQPVFRKFGKPKACMATGANVEVFHSLRREIPFITHRFHDALINWAHPLGPLSYHIYGGAISSHRFTDTYENVTKVFETGGVSLSDDCKSLGNYL